MNVKSALLASALAFAMCGCSDEKPEQPDPTHPLIGPWKGDGWTTHFRPDGTVQETYPARPFGGRYRLLARSRVEIDMDHMRPDEKTVWVYSIGGGRLVLTCENYGAEYTFDRVK